ncbi:hypothetical protein FKV24_019055 [Lysobacter maris]|uniref:Uncharacterized protein n=1 Tax=Marilutibacter maris TaxID=1605891 RepID=A0A507ZR60_9GAMM|nr:hypothetical protein [Lysobacter maris]KAB8161365.1 hypothetical protein FKV24_019055 [Lysobacter maris]
MIFLRETIVATCMLVTVAMANVTRAESNIDFTGTFSSVCRHNESGDLLGMEVSFVPDGDGMWLLAQRYEGVPTRPALLSVGHSNDSHVDAEVKSEDGDFFMLEMLSNGRLRIKYMDGQVSHTGSDSEVLYKRASPSWSTGDGAQIPVCE